MAFILPGGYVVRPLLHRLRGAKIGRRVWISQYVYIDELHPEGVSIGDNSSIGLRTTILTHMYWGPRKSQGGFRPVIIGKDVFVGPHCLLLPGVKIGEGAVVRGGSVVTKNVPPFTLWGPPDARPLGRITVPLTHEYSYEDFLRGLKPLSIQPETCHLPWQNVPVPVFMLGLNAG